MTRQLSESEQARARESLWSIACRAQGLNAMLLPAALRPMPVEEAVEAIVAYDDPRADERVVLAVHLAGAGAAIRGGVVAPLVALGPVVVLPDILVLLQLVLGVGQAVTALAMRFVGLILAGKACSWPVGANPAKSVYGSAKHETEICSHYRTRYTLDELRTLLDPRAWSRCGDLFRDTHRVRDNGRRPYARFHPDPDPLGDPWRGHLYENAEFGALGNELILAVDYMVQKDPSTGAVTKIQIDFGLVDSLSSSVGPFEFSGLLRRNSGTLIATDLKGDRDAKSVITCTKTVQGRRVSSWSGGSGWDFGEIFNYLAPAALTLWTVNVQAVVPCCTNPAK